LFVMPGKGPASASFSQAGENGKKTDMDAGPSPGMTVRSDAYI